MAQLLKVNGKMIKVNNGLLQGNFFTKVVPKIIVTTNIGATITAVKGEKIITKVNTEGNCILFLPEAGTWTVSASLNGNTSATQTVTIQDSYSTSFNFISSTLNNNTWNIISQISSAGQAANYWSIGDTKQVVLNGTIGQTTFSNYTTYAFIIGINHNSSLEGNNRIHFQIGKTSLTNGIDISLTDSQYGNAISSTGYFSMNASETNSGGWASSQMRSNICGTNLINYSGTFIGIIPSELRGVLKSVTKYTDNTGNKSTAAENVTATTDYIFLPSEYEVMGSISYANSNESSKQQQYAYYVSNSKLKYIYSDTSTAVYWWFRSPSITTSTGFARVTNTDTINSAKAQWSRGFSPCFCV